MPVKIFFCYAHEDEPLLNQLKTHLKPLQRQGFIDIWYDRDISGGTEWESEIDEHLNTAQIILLLVSPDFLASDYCYSVEMKLALERHKRREARVIPVILRKAFWQDTLGNIQALPTDAKPVSGSGWHDLDEAFFNVAEGIRKAAIDMVKKPDERPYPLSDFSISYNSADRPWAKWIAWQLEEAGFTILLQEWDSSRSKSNFILNMKKGAQESKRTVIVLSPDYLPDLNALFSDSEWGAPFQRDPSGKKGVLLPIRVKECRPEDELKSISYIDLVGLDESAARKKLLANVKSGHGKPTYPPDFQEEDRPSSTEWPALPKLILHSFGKQPVFPSVPLTMQPIPPPPAAPRFEMAIYLVTNREFKEFLDANPGWQPGERFRYEKEVDSHYLSHWSKERTEYPADLAEYPVVNVSSYAAQAYATWRGSKLRKSLRLPLKDEWEFAARAGRSSWSETLMEELHKDQVRVNYDYIAEEGMTPVGTFDQNPYGLYDLLGNVYELCFLEANMTYACGGAYYSPREQLINPLHLKPRECHRDVGFRYVHDLSNH